jgi:hypothetical protein
MRAQEDGVLQVTPTEFGIDGGTGVLYTGHSYGVNGDGNEGKNGRNGNTKYQIPNGKWQMADGRL